MTTASVVSPPTDAEHAGAQALPPPPGRVADRSAVQTALNAWLQTHNGRPLRVELTETDPARGPHVACPVALVCDEHGPYRAFAYHAQGVWLRLSFGTGIVRTITLPLLRQEFEVASARYTPPELNFDGWSLHLSDGMDMAFRRGDAAIRILGWQNGRVQGRLQTRLTSVTGHRVRCAPMDAAMPPECVVSGRVDVPLLLEFDLPLAIGALDCARPDPRRSVGRVRGGRTTSGGGAERQQVPTTRQPGRVPADATKVDARGQHAAGREALHVARSRAVPVRAGCLVLRVAARGQCEREQTRGGARSRED